MLIKSYLSAVLLVVSFNVSAALLSIDWKTAGDLLITHDSVSGLDWLDLTETDNLSYNDVSSQLGTGGDFEGWRYATAAEAEDLFVQFGLPIAFLLEIPPSEANSTAITNMVTFLGDTLADYPANSVFYGTSGVVEYAASPGTHQRLGAYLWGDPTRATIETSVTECCPAFDTVAETYFGHYLVQSTVVPVPSAVWLFGSGLIGLLGVARRMRV